MPYQWSSPPQGADPDLELQLWPHRSLPRRGFAAFVLATFALITIPLYPLLGTMLLWGLLPFLLLAVGGVWWGLEATYRSARLREVLTITPDELRLVRTNPRGDVQEWACNRYWARVQMHPEGGPVEHYLTLRGGGREVEIGAFLSEDERKVLHGELADAIRPPPAPMTG
ncbi:DUF2244 domain-containing protein [Roseovarius nitratireducens]|uniref:DUF2244 domain-containing protein n=1 Tax=Roseovarius nitratireducens TaxID=2044597 RepID=UPI000CE2046E|nr:DUF2244 domain-containing protein [Roseovarius nitratireducens]